MVEFTTGDDVVQPISLKKNGAAFQISNAATVKAAIIDKARNALLTRPVIVSPTEPGSNWSESLIVVKIPSAATEGVRPQMVELEIEVNDGGKTTWRITDVILTKGLIR